ncbi:MAG TPA: host attachment protein [Kofleriaceae bacterium]|nr:host attachment protein [Kofleriaceae bacterium]
MTKNPVLPVDLLRKLGDDFRHVEQEHRRQPLRSATRRRLSNQMQAIEDRFERLLLQWVADDAMRGRWRAFLRGRAPVPEQPAARLPPLFKGRTEAGATLEVRPTSGGHDIFLDGARIDQGRAPWHLVSSLPGPVRIGEHACEEVFDAPPLAIEALAQLAGGHARPPWPWARELLEDGLIDPEMALTARGKRCLATARPAVAPQPVAPRSYCVVVADAARARVLALDGGGENRELDELAEITNPAVRVRHFDIGSDPNRREIERHFAAHFAAQIAEEAVAVWSCLPSCELILAASPAMLAVLRPEVSRRIGSDPHVDVRELPRDLTKLARPRLHDQLSAAGLMPSREPPHVGTASTVLSA